MIFQITPQQLEVMNEEKRKQITTMSIVSNAATLKMITGLFKEELF